MSMRTRAWLVVVLVGLTAAPQAAIATPVREMYATAMSREKVVRAAWEQSADPDADLATLRRARATVSAYEAIVRRYPTSGYCDNALWQAAGLSVAAFAHSALEQDKRTAVRLFEFLAREYPRSPFAARAANQARRLESPAPADAPNAAKGAEKATRARENVPVTPVSTIRTIRRTVLAEVVRVSIELDREVSFHAERVENPARLLFDLPATKAASAVKNANWAYQDDVVRHIRLGQHPNETTRVVLDLDGVSRYTVVTLYNPYRILIDCERAAGNASASTITSQRPAALPSRIDSTPASPGATRLPSPPPAPAKTTPALSPEPARPKAAEAERTDGSDHPAAGAPPTAKREAPAADDTAKLSPKKPEAAKPSAEKAEKTASPGSTDHNRVSMARQLGLGIARVVIDPGHGGRDPGAEGPGKNEADVVLDIALRLEKLLSKQPGVDVVLTRHTDVFVPLEERTEIANREQADLFLSIHANASRNQNAKGVESYYLNFATNPDAEAVAARENAASERTMNSLPDIIKAITLNNKLNESKDFASLVQDGLARRLRASNKSLKNLGVKQAPFVVLIGAAMPSVLVEVSFLTNQREGQLLTTESYRQKIAESLADAVARYRKNLKNANVTAHE